MSRDRRWLLLAVALASACAAQHDEPTGAAFDGEAKSVDAPAEPTLEAEPDDSGEPNLAAYERQLAANEARLRELGVALPADVNTLAGGDAAPAHIEDNAKESKPNKQQRKDRKGAGSGVGGVAQPSARPGTAPSADGGGAKSIPRDRAEGGKGKDKTSEKKREDADDDFAPRPPAPDPAKAAPLSPTQSPELDAATRCQQVCELGHITCELSVQICELADRHEGEDDYLNACERASEDCTAAQEACDACEA